jgi:D-alanyl-D-alanine carboxypeptidase/D-alanyl-D-alanine-endopeptidase (penicillin-binding protein 4)
VVVLYPEPVRRWAAPSVLVLVIVGALVLATRVSVPRAAGATTTTTLGTPVLSARRAAAALAGTTADIRLSTALRAAMADPTLTAGGAHTCLAVAQGTRTLFAQGDTQHLIPASNLKLLTAFAALTKLGPDTRLTTEVRADHAPVGGVVDGNLYLVGGGDPLIQTADYNASMKDDKLPDNGYTHLEDLARAVVAAGVQRVTGAVVGDEARYDTQRSVPTWKPSYLTDAEVGPLSALEVNDGFVQFPPLKTVAAPSPAVLASGSLNALLTKMGVVVSGQPAQGLTPPASVKVTSIDSLPVSGIVGEMLRQSDNNTAELLTKELGRRFGGAGSTAAGVAVTRATLAAAGFPVDQLAAVDGSGLDRTDQVTCPLLLSVLEKVGPTSPLAQGLPVAAQTGTLRKRFLAAPGAGHVVAKTGSLDRVASLSGYVVGPSPPLTFAMVSNDIPRDAVGVAFGDRIGNVLATYPDAPPVASLGPRPAAAAGAAVAGGGG